MRILSIQIANGFSPEARVAASLLHHRDSDWDALVLHHAWKGDGGASEAFESEARVRVARFDLGWRPNPMGHRSTAAKIASWARLYSMLPCLVSAARVYAPDVIYSSQQLWDCLVATHIARALKVPHVVHLHYTVGPWLGDRTLKRLLTCDQVIAISAFIHGQALQHGVAAERLTTILNTPAQTGTFAPGTREAVRTELGIPAESPLFGMVARMDPGKGQSDVISAFAQMAAECPEARLVLVGDGTQQHCLRAEASATASADRIIFTGFRSDVQHILIALDVFVHPSRNEPFGLAIAEASAAGLPVVAYADGAVPELVSDGETGLLSKPGDVPGLTASMARLVREPQVARRMGLSGKARMAVHFRADSAGAMFSDVLRRAASTRNQQLNNGRWATTTIP